MTGFEPATPGTTIQCSTVELHPPINKLQITNYKLQINLKLKIEKLNNCNHQFQIIILNIQYKIFNLKWHARRDSNP